MLYSVFYYIVSVDYDTLSTHEQRACVCESVCAHILFRRPEAGIRSLPLLRYSSGSQLVGRDLADKPPLLKLFMLQFMTAAKVQL